MRKQQKPEMGHIYKSITGFHKPVLHVHTAASSQGIFGTDGSDGQWCTREKGRCLSRGIQTGTPSVFLYHNQNTALSLGIKYITEERPTETGAINLVQFTFAS